MMCIIAGLPRYVNAQDLTVFWDVKRFYDTSTNRRYIETFFSVPANMVSYRQLDNDHWQGELEVKINLFDKLDIINESHYRLTSTPVKTTREIHENFTDLIRFPIVHDTTGLTMLIADRHDSTSFFFESIDFECTIPKEPVFLSDIVLINQVYPGEENNAFYKHGNIIIPKFINYYPSEISELSFYCEVYQKEDTLAPYIVRYHIVNETGMVMPGFSAFKKTPAQQTTFINGGFSIENLSSGNYFLHVEIRDQNNQQVSFKRLFFQRTNKNMEVKGLPFKELEVITDNFAEKYDLPNIIHHTLALKPIASPGEKQSIDGAVSTNNLEMIQNYFYSFWEKRSPLDPEETWMAYAKHVQHVEATYTTKTLRGFETDRGRVYLQYGKPTELQLVKNSNMGFYEIWYYETLRNQANVRFVFLENQFDRSDFNLVHATLPEEIQDPVWNEFLKSNP